MDSHVCDDMLFSPSNDEFNLSARHADDDLLFSRPVTMSNHDISLAQSVDTPALLSVDPELVSSNARPGTSTPQLQQAEER